MADKRKPGPAPIKIAPIGIRVTAAMRDEIAAWAAEEKRSMSSLIDIILTEALDKRRAESKGRRGR